MKPTVRSGYRRAPGGVEPNAILRPIRSTPAEDAFPPRRGRGFYPRLFTLKPFRLQNGSTHDRQETEMRPTERVAGSYGLAGNGGRELSRGSHVGFEDVFFHQSHLAPSARVPQPFMASNPAIAASLQANALVGRVAELLSSLSVATLSRRDKTETTNYRAILWRIHSSLS